MRSNEVSCCSSCCPRQPVRCRPLPRSSVVSDLETKIIGEGEEAQKKYEAFTEWCEETSKTAKLEIHTGKNEVVF